MRMRHKLLLMNDLAMARFVVAMPGGVVWRDRAAPGWMAQPRKFIFRRGRRMAGR